MLANGGRDLFQRLNGKRHFYCVYLFITNLPKCLFFSHYKFIDYFMLWYSLCILLCYFSKTTVKARKKVSLTNRSYKNRITVFLCLTQAVYGVYFGPSTRDVPKVMSNNFCKVTCFIIDKPHTPPYSTQLSSFFHIIATSLYAFLPAFWKFENPPAVELRSSHPKTLTHCFLNSLRFPIFKMFHPSSNTARTHAHPSITR